MSSRVPAKVKHTAVDIGQGEYGKFTYVSYTPKAGLSFKKWTEGLAVMGVFARSLQWWIADALLSGEDNYGEKYAQAVESTGKDPKTLLEWVRVAKAVAQERRREELTFGHHESVSALDPESQTYWLSRAIEGDKKPNGETEMWSTRRLRAELKKEGHEVPEPVVEVEVEDKVALVKAVHTGKVPVEVLTVDVRAVRDLYKRGTHEIPGLRLTAPGADPDAGEATP